MNSKAPRLLSRSARAGSAALCLLIASAAACNNKPTPTPDKEPLPESAPASAVTAAPSASAAAEAPTIPTLALERFEPAGAHPSGVYAVEGALMVEEEFRVGRIVGESIEWVGKIPSSFAATGPNHIASVHGRWPDSIGVVFSSSEGRSPQPTYKPLTGVGVQYTASPGGGLGYILGVARLGESTLVAGHSQGGIEFTTVRGAVVRKMQTPEQAGCKPGEVWTTDFRPAPPAIAPSIIESTLEGTLVSIGRLCEKRGAAAEVWDKTGKSRIIDLSPWWKKGVSWPKLVKGIGDEIWAYGNGWMPVLHYRNGEFEAIPQLERPIRNIFVSPRGQLHANDGQALHRYDGGKWIPVGKLAEPDTFLGMAMDDKETIWIANGAVYRARPTPGAAVPLTPGAAFLEGCATPFVYLYEVNYKNEPKFTYPATRKALSTFADVASIGLVEFEDSYDKRLGITVSSKAQGEAVIAHVNATMKEETPWLLCFEPPKGARKIDMNAKK